MKNITTAIVALFAIFTFASAQTNTVKLRSAKQVQPLLMNDLAEASSYKNEIINLGYHTTGVNANGGTIYTSDDNDWIIYNAPVKKADANTNKVIVYSLVYYSREVDDLDSVLSYLDGYYNSELYDGYGLEPDEASHEMEGYFSSHKSEVLQLLSNGVDKSLDNSKYYIRARMEKNTLIRGIRLVNKSENGIVKPYYTAFAYIEDERYDSTPQTISNEENNTEITQEGTSEKLSDEYTEAEFQGEDEVELKVPKHTLGMRLTENGWESVDNDNTITTTINKSKTVNSRPSPKKLAPSMKGIAITEKSMIGKWRASNGSVFNFMYGKVEVYPPNSQMIDAQTNYKGNGVIWLSAWGMLIKQLQVISKTSSKMVLYDMETGRKMNFAKY
jgi:hypothetical protein